MLKGLPFVTSACSTMLDQEESDFFIDTRCKNLTLGVFLVMSKVAEGLQIFGLKVDIWMLKLDPASLTGSRLKCHDAIGTAAAKAQLVHKQILRHSCRCWADRTDRPLYPCSSCFIPAPEQDRLKGFELCAGWGLSSREVLAVWSRNKFACAPTCTRRLFTFISSQAMSCKCESFFGCEGRREGTDPAVA